MSLKIEHALVIGFLFLFESFVFSAPNGPPTGHAFDLLWPVFNLLILLAFLIFQFRQSISTTFHQYVKEVIELHDFAVKKDADAQVHLEMYSKRMQSFDEEENNIQNELERDKKAFANAIEKETSKIIATMQKDGQERIESERESSLLKMETEFVDHIIQRAQETVKSDRDIRQKMDASLLEQVSQ